MTKKEYELIAHALNLTLRQHADAGNAVPRVFVYRLLLNLADLLARDNPKFNRTVFFNVVAKDVKISFGDER